MGLPTFDVPPDITLGRPFWDAIERGELCLPQCSSCRRWHWYPDSVGPCCPGATYDWQPVAGTGTIHTFTRIRRSFLPGASTAPFTVALVELDGVDGVRLVANLDDAESWTIGDRVRVDFRSTGDRAHPVFVRA
jgi:uncharacterized OB-fold protein